MDRPVTEDRSSNAGSWERGGDGGGAGGSAQLRPAAAFHQGELSDEWTLSNLSREAELVGRLRALRAEAMSDVLVDTPAAEWFGDRLSSRSHAPQVASRRLTCDEVATAFPGPGLSSLQISKQMSPLPGGEFYVGPYGEHPGNQAQWCEPDPVMEMAQECERFGWCALPASLVFHERRRIDVHHVELAVGGNAMRYRAGAGVAPACAGDRKPVTQFSDRSRLAMLRFTQSIDRSRVDAEAVWFVTLTYPSVWSNDWKVWKKHLNHIRVRLEQRYGPCPTVWKLEPQRRGAPHFHWLLFCPPSIKAGGIDAFRRWLAQAWYEVVNSGDEKHLRAGTGVEQMRSWNGVTTYAAKYLGKSCCFFDHETGEVLKSGRFWGVWRKDMVPIRIVSRTLGQSEWCRVRRVLRRYLGKHKDKSAFAWTGRPRSCSAFVPYHVVQRAIEWFCPWEVAGGGETYADVLERDRVARIRSRAAEMGLDDIVPVE